MPPAKGRKRPAPKADTAEVDSKLAAVDLLGAARARAACARAPFSRPPPSPVSEMRSQLNAVMEPAIEDMRREVAFVLMRLPARVKAMRMSDFLRECGGDVALLAERERRAGKLARTAAKERLMGAAAFAPPPPRAPAGAGAGAGDFDFADADAGAMPPPPSRTPGAHGPASRLPAAPAGGAALPSRTPALAMRAAPRGAAPGARSPAAAAFSTFLPKTPAPDDARRPRGARRNEMVYHVLVSENGSPIAEQQRP